MADLIAFNEAHADTVMPFFRQEHLERAQEKGDLSDKLYLAAVEQNRRLSREEGIDKALKTHSLDALIAPSTGPAWTIDKINGDRYLGSSSTLPAVSGYPNITVPMGFVHALPVGISFFASAYQEDVLLRLAFAFEQSAQARRPPVLD